MLTYSSDGCRRDERTGVFNGSRLHMFPHASTCFLRCKLSMMRSPSFLNVGRVTCKACTADSPDRTLRFIFQSLQQTLIHSSAYPTNAYSCAPANNQVGSRCNKHGDVLRSARQRVSTLGHVASQLLQMVFGARGRKAIGASAALESSELCGGVAGWSQNRCQQFEMHAG